MIRVIIERRAKDKEKMAGLLRELRASAMHRPGYITGETLVNTEDSSDVVVISTWDSLEAWKDWDTSQARADLNARIEPLLAEKPVVKTYQMMATEEER
jgi:heme-degrading monooxygenase HmoA